MNQQDFKYFEFLKSEGFSSEKAYLEAKKLRYDYFTCIRMLRAVYHLNLSEAKNITLVADNKFQQPEGNLFNNTTPQGNMINTLKIAAQLLESETESLSNSSPPKNVSSSSDIQS
jgi:hypothetical protein